MNFTQNEIMTNVRTKFKCPHNHKTTGNTGDLMPIYAKEILPGDMINLPIRSLIKMTTPNFQTMDQAFLDIFAFYVPRILVWKHWKNFQGEKVIGPYAEQPQYTIPTTTAPENGWEENTIADYLGIPTKVPNIEVDSAYFRAYCLIWNEFFRDQNRQNFTDFSDGDENIVGSNGNNYVTDAIKGGKCLKASKLHDYFTSTLLSPVGRETVYLPLGTSAPVTTTVEDQPIYSIQPLKFRDQAGYNVEWGTLAVDSSGSLGLKDRTSTGFEATYIQPRNLITDLSKATAATINQLRLAFQLQKIFEANNRSGSRYAEILANRWQQHVDDLELMRPKYLGGKRIPLNIEMVVQTSSTDAESPLGQISGFSNTYDEMSIGYQGFKQHGIMMVLAVVRHQRTYQQGLHKKFMRRNMEDFYMPEFQNIGEVPVYNYEIYATGDAEKDNQPFGYNPYATEYRTELNMVTGQFRSNATNSFDNWHYADDYGDTPVNGEEWIVENVDAVDRTLTLQSSVVNQFYFDFYFDETIIRTMPPTSIPGFIDHH